MKKPKNIIKKLTVEIDTNSMEQGLQIKDDIDGFLELHIYPKIDTYLNSKIPDNELWRIENLKMEIDLDSTGSIKEISPVIISKLAPELNRIQTENKSFQPSNSGISSIKRSNATAFFDFLKNGRYPWWLQGDLPIPISDLEGMDKADFQSQFQTVTQSTTTLYRLVHQFDYLYLNKIYLLFYSEKDTSTTIRRFDFDFIVEKSLKPRFWKAVFEQNFEAIPAVFREIILSKSKWVTLSTSPKTEKKTPALFLPKKMEKILFELLQFCNENLEIPIRISASKSLENAFSFELSTSTQSALESNKITVKKITDLRAGLASQKGIKNALKKGRKQELEHGLIFKFSESDSEEKITVNSAEKLPDILPKIALKKDEFDQDFVPEEGVLLGNAGLVLLHPFLKHFFINMDLLSGKEVSPEKQDLAAHLLHYVATKNEQPSEHELLFEKYLCNIPALQPVDRFIELTKEQKKSCDELLEAVLNHWSGLRTNAVDALRSEFLMREGKLSLKEDAHKLFLPRKTQDILLDTLPWNLHLVKLPWKKNMLYVEW